MDVTESNDSVIGVVMVETTPKLTEAIILEWVKGTDGRWFTVAQMDKDMSIQSPGAKNSRRVALHRFTKGNVLERHVKKEGMYRLRLDTFEELDFKNANTDAYLPILLPFNLHEYVRLYSKNIVVVAGTPNAGKTATMFNVILLNEPYCYGSGVGGGDSSGGLSGGDIGGVKDRGLGETIGGGIGGKKGKGLDGIYYFSSEMGAEELSKRLSKFNDRDLTSWQFKALSLSENFVDAIRPNALNIIDYWEFGADSEFYAIADSMRQITKRLERGICFIALQKKKGAEYGRGAEFSLEKPRLYIAMDSGILTVVKAKNWAQDDVNPNGMKIRFKLVGGANFVQVSDPIWPDKDK